MHPIALIKPDAVLGHGIHEGFEWIIMRNPAGFRCGYIRIPEGHPWFGKSYEEIDCNVNVHGGLTFADVDVADTLSEGERRPGESESDYVIREADRIFHAGWWLGFDCAHGGDAPDPALQVDAQFLKIMSGYGTTHYGTIRTQEYVEAECKSLCEQAKAVQVPETEPD